MDFTLARIWVLRLRLGGRIEHQVGEAWLDSIASVQERKGLPEVSN